MEGYKETKLGWIPKEWEVVKLGEVGKLNRGKFQHRPRNDPKFYGGKIPFVQTGDVVNAGIFLDEYSQTLNEKGLSVSRLFPEGTILITIAANIGETAITKFPVAFPDSMVGLIVNPDIANIYFFKSQLDFVQPQLDSLSSVSAQKNINLHKLNPFLLLLPPKAEQEKIAAILGTVDARREGLEQRIAATETLKKGLMQRLFREGIGHTEFQDSELGRIPKGWQVVKLGEVAQINPKLKPNYDDKDLVSFISMSDVTEKARVEKIHTREYQEVKKGYTKFEKESILIAKITPCFENGKGGLLERMTGSVGFGSTEFHVLKVKTPHSPQFIYFHTIATPFRKQGERNMTGSAGQKRVPTGFIRNYPIPLPPKAEQEKIAALLGTVDERLENLRAQVVALDELKRGLMQQLLTGRLRTMKYGK